MGKYIHTTAAVDWFFVHESPLTVSRLALWATREDGSVTGLVAVTSPYQAGQPLRQTTALLVEPPPIQGAYKHLSALSHEERDRVGTF
jgi:hypothetical protein